MRTLGSVQTTRRILSRHLGTSWLDVQHTLVGRSVQPDGPHPLGRTLLKREFMLRRPGREQRVLDEAQSSTLRGSSYW